MKKYVYFATALIALAGCTSDEFVGDKQLDEANENAAISFGFEVPMPTRAAGAEAATKLGNQFIVYGEKGEDASGSKYKTDGTAHQLVFQNYVVKYTASTAYTTTSNTKDWEYVGFDQTYGENVTPKAGETQTIKYWDYSAANYVFTAISALESDLSSGKVKVTKIQEKTDGNKVYDKGYKVDVTADASLDKLYFADRVEIAQGTGKDRTAVNAYGGNVTFNFHNSLTQVRAGVYETIPGYEVSSITFYKSDGSTAIQSGTPAANAFGGKKGNISGDNFEGTINVTYYNGTDGPENEPKVNVTLKSGTTEAEYLVLGNNFSTLDASVSKFLGTSATAPTWDTPNTSDPTKGDFTSVLPKIDNSENMELKVGYTLYNTVTKETIVIPAKTVTVPAQYLQWKPNFKYTYLFKITDDDLYPITFDAVVVEAEDGQAEYITTVTEPSITTFGVKGGKYQVGKDQYENGSDVYATIWDATTTVVPTLGTNVNVYKVTTTDATNFPITEASVAEAIAEVSAKTHKVTPTLVNTDASTNFTDAPDKVTEVPTEDGKTVAINALKLTGVKTGTYAVEYVKSARTYKAQEVTFATQAAYDAAFAAQNLYTDDTTSTPAEATSWVDATTKFYKKVVNNAGVYAYKVIVVAP